MSLQRPSFWKTLTAELIIGLTIFFGLMIFESDTFEVSKPSLSAKSFFIGFMSFYLPSSFFTLRSWRYTGAKYAREMMQSMYLAEIGKFTLTFVCFALSFKLLQPINAGIVFVTYLCFFGLHQLLIVLTLKQKA